MAVTDQQKLDFLLKKIGYTKTKTGSVVGTGAISGTPKQPFAEAIPSPLVVANSSLWNEADSIPATPPGADTTQVKVYLAATSGLRMTADATSSGQRAYIAYSTYNDTSSTRLTNWIDTQFGASYIIKVYKGDPNSGGVNLSAAGSGQNDGWFFDYSAGVLNFNDTNVPSGVTDTNIYIVGYRYVGQTGAPTSGISTFSYLDLTVERNLDVGVQGGISTFRNNIDANGIIEGIAGENKIPFLYSNLAALPNAGTYHGMFAHVHSEGRGYFAHAGNWLELVNKDTSGNVGLSGDLDVDGHTNLDNVSVAGVTTMSGNLTISNTAPTLFLTDTDHNSDFRVRVDGGLFTITDETNSADRLNINSSGVVNIPGNTNFGNGIDVTANITATGNADIDGDLDVDGHTNLDNISVAGVSTFTGDATFSGNVSIGGTLTYEDVTNVDSVGLLTARSGIRVTGGVIEALAGENKIPSLYANMAALPSASTYHGMFAHVHSTGRGYFAHAGNWLELVNADTTGRVGTGTESYFIDRLVSTSTTATSLNVTGVTTAVTVDINGDLDVDGHTNLDNVSIAGVATITAPNNTDGAFSINASNNAAPFSIVTSKSSGGIGTYLFSNSVGRYDFKFENTYGGNWYTGTTFHTRILWTAPNESGTTPEVCSIMPNTASAGAGGALHSLEFKVTDNTSGLKTAYWMRHNQHQFYLNGNQVGLEVNSTLGVGVTSYIYHGYTGGASDTHTRFGFPTNDNIVFDTDGTERLRINNSSSTFAHNIVANADLNVDGHTNLDNVNIVGVATVTGEIKFPDYSSNSNRITFGNSDDLQIFHSSGANYIKAVNLQSLNFATNNTNRAMFESGGHFRPIVDGTYDLGINATRWRNVYADTYVGNGNLGIVTATEIDLNGDLDVDGHTELDNVNIVGVTTAAGHVLPSADVTYDLGSSSKQWRNLYADNIVSAPGNGFIGPDLTVRNFKATGISTFAGNARFNSTIAVHDGTTGSNGQYLKSIGTGVTWASFPTLRTRDTIVASAGQTSFTFNYTVNFIDVFVNGIKLTDSEFTATNGTSITLAVGCFVGDIVEFVSYNTISAGGGGGGGTLNNIVEDTSPQLGGNLDLFSKTINGTGGINITGVVTATTFIGDGSGLTGITASGTGVVIKNNDNTVGTAGTINFGDDLSVTPIVAGIVTVGIDTSQINLNKLNVSGISTFNGNIDVNADLDVDGHTELDNLRVSGVSTLSGQVNVGNNLTVGSAIQVGGAAGGSLQIISNDFLIDAPSGDEIFLRANGGDRVLAGRVNAQTELFYDNAEKFRTTAQGIEVTGHSELDNVNIAGVVTAITFKGALEATSGSFSSNIDANGDLDVDGHTNLDNLSVAGVSTFTSGITANGAFQGSTGTFSNNLTVNGTLEAPVISASGASGNDGIILVNSAGGMNNDFSRIRQVISDDSFRIENKASGSYESLFQGKGNAEVKLYFSGDEKFETTAKGIQVGTGVTVETNGQATYTGIVTALKFVGDGSSLTNVSAAGVNTTNVRADTLVVGENTTGVSTFHRVNIPTNKSMFFGNTNQASISYPTSGYMYLYGGIEGDMVIQTGGNRAIKMEASGNFEIDTGGNEIAIKATKDGPVELYQNGYGAPDGLRFATTGVGVTVIGITSMTDNLMVGTAATITPAGAAQFAGIVTASSFIGDGSGLTGITASGSGIIVKEGGTTVGTAGTINFVGVDVSPASAGIVTVSTATTSITDGNSKLFVNNVSSSNGNGSFEVFLNEFTSNGTAEALNMHQPSDGYARIDLFHGSTPQTIEVNAKTVYSGYARHRLKFETNNASYGGQLDFLPSVGQWNFYSTYQGTQKQLMGFNYNTISVGTGLMYPITNNGTDLGSSSYKWRQFHTTGVNAGVVTATSVDVDDFLDVGSNIQLGNAGVITATSYRGDGSQLTGISGSQNVFQTVAVSGQSNVVADSTTDTLTLVAGSNMTITTNASSDTITFASSGGSSTPAYTDVQVAYELTNSSSSGNGWRINGNGFANSTGNPDIYLVRGQKYRFINNSGGSHPFQIQSDASTAYSTGVTNNNASSGNIDFIPQNSAPAKLYYNCTNHGGMLGVIYIIGEPGRGTTSAATGSIAQAAYADITIPTTGKTFALLKIAISAPAWVVLYTDTSSRTSDAAGTGSGRSEGTDPTPGSGVLAEVSTTTSGASTFKMTPGVIGWNDDGTPATQIYARVYNKRATSGSNAITVTLTTVNIEA